MAASPVERFRRRAAAVVATCLIATGLIVAGLSLAWPGQPSPVDLSTVRTRLIAGDLESLDLVDSTLTARGRGGLILRTEPVTPLEWQQLASLALRLPTVPSMRATVVTGDRLAYRLGLTASYAVPIGFVLLILTAVTYVFLRGVRWWRTRK